MTTHRPVSLLGIGGYVPATRLTNKQLEHRFDTTDEWITQRTGVRVRYHCAPGEATSDLAVAAGRRALEHATSTTIDAVIIATTTPDHPCPASASATSASTTIVPYFGFAISFICGSIVET